MGFEISIDSDYFGHPKTLHLISLLGPDADVYPLRLWFWASKYARSGYLGTPSRLIDVIEPGIGWKGRGRTKGRLRDALHTAQFLESDGGGNYYIHDWNEGIGRQISLYERKKAKQRLKYAEEKGILPEDHPPNSPNPSNPSNPSKPDNDNAPAEESAKRDPLALHSGNGTGPKIQKADPECRKCGGSGYEPIRIEHERHGTVKAVKSCDCQKEREKA